MHPDGHVIWITGLSGAGKTTIATALHKKLPGSILLDGDDLRHVLDAGTDKFDLASRKKLAFTYARLARMLADQGFTVIVATISLFHDIHAWNRENLPAYLEVFLDISAPTRASRDPKGLYKAERAGLIGHMAGNTVPVEFPLHPDLVFDEEKSVQDAVGAILRQLTT